MTNNLFHKPNSYDDRVVIIPSPKKSLLHIPPELDSTNNIQPSETNINARLLKRDIDDIKDSDEFLELLSEENSIYNNTERDLKRIQEFINAKKNNNIDSFMYKESYGENSVDGWLIQTSVDPTKSSNAFIISNTGNLPESDSIVNYRITLRNSKNLVTNDVLAFIQAFQNEAKQRKTYIRCKVIFEQADGIIFYTDKENLLETVKILEDLKNEQKYGANVINAIKNFGRTQPFAATLGDDAYYSIAMRGTEPKSSRLKSTIGGGLSETFNEYMNDILNQAYNHLLSKYNNDANRITATELYDEIIAYHTQRMGVGETIPLWMNNRIYQELKSKRYTI